jgi:hypothetical protein
MEPLAAITALSSAAALFGFVLRATGAATRTNPSWLLAGGAILTLVSATALVIAALRRGGIARVIELLPLTVMGAGLWFFLGTVAYQITSMLALRVDLLSYSESGFLNDVLRATRGLPIYAPPLENQSTVYTPGSPLLTGWLASLAGNPLDVRTLRLVQFGYVLVAAAAATGIADRLARVVAPGTFRDRWLWRLWWAPALLMVATEPRFNTYTPSLNSDGLALAYSMLGFLLIAQHVYRPRRGLLVLMVLFPAVGFFIKQNLVAWAGVFAVYLVASGVPFLVTGAVAAAAGGAVLAAMSLAYALWGADFWFWTVTSYAPKTVSLARGLQHLLGAGGYLAMGMAAGWMLLRRDAVPRGVLGLWLAWLALLLLQAYTSGFAWAANHLGPSVVMAVVWLGTIAVAAWPTPATYRETWRLAAASVVAAGAVIGIFSGLGFAREPLDPVPADVERYFRAIEQEFEGEDASRVLMDYGTWVYAARGVVMPDRGYATHVHLEPNQPVARALFAGSIDRIRHGTYDKILVRGLDSGRSSYDYLNRGSGMREAIHERYDEVRRIPGVAVGTWWPRHMLDEIQVFVRRP